MSIDRDLASPYNFVQLMHVKKRLVREELEVSDSRNLLSDTIPWNNIRNLHRLARARA